MAEHRRLVGEPLYLNLQLPLNDIAKHVLAYLYDDSNSLIGSYPLMSVGGGFYEDHTIAMPNTDQVRAVYVVFDDPAHTIESFEYGRSIDTFDRNELVPVQFPDDSVLGEVSSDSLTGVIEEGDVVGVAEAENVESSVDEDSATGVVSVNDVESEIDDSGVTGKVEDC